MLSDVSGCVTGTYLVVTLIAGKCGVPCKTIYFTLPEMRAEKYRFDENDLVIFGFCKCGFDR